MRMRTLFLTHNACYKSGKRINPVGIMLHSTGKNNPNLQRYLPEDASIGIGRNPYDNHWNRSKPDNQYKCPHAFIGKLNNGNIATIQTLPWHYEGWHCGGKGNQLYIGIEICEDGLEDSRYFNKIWLEAAEVCAYLCKMHRWNPLESDTIIDHATGYKMGLASNHGDIGHWLIKHGKSLSEFRLFVAQLLIAEYYKSL